MRKTLMILAAVCVRTAVAISTSTTAVPGEWTSNMADAQTKADPSSKVHVPIVAIWANPGCGYCETLKSALSTSTVSKWMKKRGYYFVLGNGSASVSSFVGMSGEYPFVRVAWRRTSSTGNTYEISKKWHGRSGKMPVTGGSLAQQFMDSVDMYVGSYVPSAEQYVLIKAAASPTAGGTVTVDGKKGAEGSQVVSGEKVTLKATVKSGYSFGGWYSAAGTRLSESLTFAYATGKSDETVTAKFYQKSTDYVTVNCKLPERLETKVSKVEVPIEVSSFSVVADVKATGLPSGLKVDKSKRAIVGTPSKSGVYTVVVSAKNASGQTGSTEKMRLLVMSAKEHYLTVGCPEGMGKVSGGGIRAAGAKVTVKVSAATGWIFSHWDEGGVSRGQAKSFVYTMPDGDAELSANFISKSDDRDSIALKVDGVALVADAPAERELVCGVKVDWPILPSALSATTAEARGLPSGLKLVKKLVDKATGTYSYSISGVPTAASKVNSRTGAVTPSKAEIRVKPAGKNTKTFGIGIFVRPLPAWACGTFTGLCRSGGRPDGKVTVTVSSSGKVSSGKFFTTESSSGQSVTGSGFDRMDVKGGQTNFVLVATAKSLGSVEMTFRDEDGFGVVTGEAEGGRTFELTQNLWLRKDTARVLPAFGTGSRQPTLVLANGLKAKFGAKGAVTLGGKVDGVAVSGSSQLEVGELMLSDWRWHLTASFPAYVAPKRGFDGYCELVMVRFEDADGDGKLDAAVQWK